MELFLSQKTANPMHNELRRTLNSLSDEQLSHIEQNWGTFFSNFNQACQEYIHNRPGMGLHMTAAWAIIGACVKADKEVLDPKAKEAFNQMRYNISEQLEKLDAIDTKIEMYWYVFAESYRECMPHCNNRVMEDFQREVAKFGHHEYIHNPDRDLQLSALAAVQQATIVIARTHATNEQIGADMTAVSQIASEQAALMNCAEFVIEPREYVMDESDLIYDNLGEDAR